MKFYIDDMLIIFPYDYIYPEQLDYMISMKRGLDKTGHMVLEMPSGTGKTITLLSLLTAFLNHHRDTKLKVVYCTRTVVEMTKTMEELKRLVRHWELEGAELKPLLALSLSARKNLCIEENVSQLTYPQEVDAACRSLTANWTSSVCPYYDSVASNSVQLPPGVYSLDDVREFGKQNGACPYYLVRHALEYADIIVHSYLYLVDPKVSGVVMEHLTPQTIVVMDEGHNIDDVCVEAMSMIITKNDARQAKEKGMKDLSAKVEQLKQTNRQKLQDEYNRLVDGLAVASAANDFRPNLPADMANEAIPGSLRQANHFLGFLGRIVDFMFKIIARMTVPRATDPLTFLTKLKEECALELRHLRFTSERLRVLLNTLEIADAFKYRPVQLIADFATTLALHYKDDRHEKPGFVVLSEPFDPSEPTIPDPILKLACVDASLAVRGVFSKYRSVVLTSGTLSPLDIYPKILGFVPVVAKSFQMTLSRKCIAPIIVTRSAEQTNILNEVLTSSYKTRVDSAAQSVVTKAYCSLLLDLARTVPDGIVCFFTGYRYMSEIMLQWDNSGFLQELSQHKLLFIETQGVEETSVALANYRKACDIGRGAIFMSIARGKIAEGIDFDRHYGRAVVMFGVPFLPPDDRSLKERLKWMESCLMIPETEFRNFDAIRQASQCIGRVLRNKTDYGMMILVDRRFALSDKKRKFPNWIQECFKENGNLSTEAAISVARTFFKEMAQPWDRDSDLGNTLFDFSELQRRGLGQPSLPVDNQVEEGHKPAAVSNDVNEDEVQEVIVAVPEREQRATSRKRKRSQM